MNVELLKIPIEDVKKIVDIRNKKTDVIKRQKYEEAARLRDEERELETKYPILREVKSNDDLVISLRDRRIDDLLDDDSI
jgi:ATP-dependent Clp protease ATP-binding subunit ClpC